jgi:hypothetical protein
LSQEGIKTAPGMDKNISSDHSGTKKEACPQAGRKKSHSIESKPLQHATIKQHQKGKLLKT